jgi:hypothetical protein
MKGRRTAAMLCVLLGHALVVWLLMDLTRAPERTRAQTVDTSFFSELIHIYEGIDDRGMFEREAQIRRYDIQPAPLIQPPSLAPEAMSESEPDEPAGSRRRYTDWPKEGKEAAARVLAREAEAERIAKMFAGPQGTWASLTKRQQDELNHFRWAPGVDGLERDENGQYIYHLNNGCVLVSFVFIGCPIGKKPPPYGDMFKDMRLYFDEQRRPATQEGNGREPESMRPPKWSKPLPERKR